MRAYEKRFAVLHRTSGVSGYFGSSTTTIYDTRLLPYFGDLIDGGFVIDAKPMGEVEASIANIHGPMLSLTLPNDGVKPCPPVPDYMLGEGALAGSFAALAQARNSEPAWRGLDFVGLATFVAYWRDKGARIGARIGDEIRWEDGSTDTIPPADERWKAEG